MHAGASSVAAWAEGSRLGIRTCLLLLSSYSVLSPLAVVVEPRGRRRRARRRRGRLVRGRQRRSLGPAVDEQWPAPASVRRVRRRQTRLSTVRALMCARPLGELRATRAAHRARQGEPPDDDDDTTVVLSVWQYLNPGDALLAAGLEASLWIAREALLDLRRGPP
jgi:hypothetical protein